MGTRSSSGADHPPPPPEGGGCWVKNTLELCLLSPLYVHRHVIG